MGRWAKLLEQARRSQANVRFSDLCGLLEKLGYSLDRKKGSHLIFWHATRRGLPRVNLQQGGSGKAKPYQVRQVIALVDEHGLEVKE